MINDYVVGAVYQILSEMFDAPEKEMYTWIHQNSKHFLTFSHYYEKTTPINGRYYLDTVDREYVYNIIGKYFTMKYWPLYKDTPEYLKTFYDELRENSKKCNWVLKGEFYGM